MKHIAFLQEVLKTATQQKSVLFVFDIDSTLYNVSPRNIEIIKDYAQKSSSINSELKSILLTVTAESTDWGIKTPLLRLNHPEVELPLFKKIKQHWNQYFFSGDFLHHDEEYPGAVEFVNALSQHAPTFYLTGRDIARMGEGTLKQLQNSRFPTDPIHNRLILKPDKDILDHEYKISELEKLAQEFDKIYFFENEPIILNAVADRFSAEHIIPICVTSTHSGRAELYENIQTVEPYYLLSDQ